MKTIYQALTALVAVLVMTGCGKSNDSNGSVVPYNSPYGCATCVGGTGSPLALAVGTSGYGEQLGLQISIAQTTQGQSGQVIANGILDVTQYSQLCGLSPGRYTVQTTTPGLLQGSATVTNLMLTATGPTTVQIMVPQIQINYGISAIGRDGTQYSSTMYVDAYVNSYQCRIAFAPRN